MDNLDYWRLCEELSIYQAAHLLIGMAPGEVEAMAAQCADLTPRSYMRYSTEIEGALTAIKRAVKRGYIKANIVHESVDLIGELPDTINPDETFVDVDSLKKWLRSKGVNTGFFFPEGTEAPDYLDESNPRYAPKLAAAVKAWQSVTDPGGKHPKQALMKWLREHASEFGLTDDEGRINETGIEEVAKVANWQPAGGAPKTPGD